MYQALYRKYRPTTLDDVVGQDVVVKTLKNAIKNNNITHAYLFTGPRGTGKTSVAKILASTINCEDLKEGILCGKCVICTQIKNKQFVDIIEIDAASNNGVDEIRELRNKINLVPSIGKYKVYIIDEVHMLTTGAFNALLKTLEEPPKHVIFILATTEPQKIPSTILSRCQRFDFRRISEKSIYSRLKIVCDNEKISIGDKEIKEIAHLADGGMRDALSLLDQVTSYSSNKITIEDIHDVNGTVTNDMLLKIINCMLEKDLYSVLKLIDAWSQRGKNLSKISEEIMILLKNSLIYNDAPKFFEDDTDLSKILMTLTKKVQTEKIIDFIEILNKNLYDMRKSSNPRLLLELTFIKLINLHTNEESNTKVLNEKKESDSKDSNEKDSKLALNKLKVEENKNEISNLKEIRINNTLAEFDKKLLLNLIKEQEGIKSFLIDPNYSRYASIILDGTLKAASKEYLIYVYNEEETTDLFNENLMCIENTLGKVFNKKYKVIATDIISWEIIKKEFNNKKKKYELREEPVEFLKKLEKKEKNNEIENLFEDNIIYS